MHPVRAFRLVVAVLLLVVGGLSALQGEWLTAAIAAACAGIAALAAVGVANRRQAEIAQRTGWQHMEPWRSPLTDVLLVLVLVFSAVPVVLHALP